MTIVISQLGDTVINADKIVAFGVAETSFLTRNGWYGEMVNSYSIYVNCGSDSKIIGGFCCKEKAMKILKEITHAIQQGIDYSLPKDEE